MQRGCVSTFAASAKMARERSEASDIETKADGGCKVLEVCAEPATDPTTAVQHSKGMIDTDRMILTLRPDYNFSKRQKFILEGKIRHAAQCSCPASRRRPEQRAYFGTAAADVAMDGLQRACNAAGISSLPPTTRGS
jgi:hypothetical protein